MKYITNFIGVGCVALLAMLFIAPGAFAQVHYVDPDNGDATSTDCTDHAAPCLLTNALAQATTGTDTVLVRVRRTGGTISLASPAAELGNANRFGAYVRGSGDAVSGTLEFTGNFQIGATGQVVLLGGTTAQFEDVTNARTDGTNPLLVLPASDTEKNPASRLMISGTLTTTSATIGALVVADDLTIEGSAADAVLRVDSLTVNSGATLTVGGATAATEIDLRVPLRKAGENDSKGILTVNGTIDGPGTVFIAHTLGTDATGRGAPGDPNADPVVPGDDYFHMSSDYMPDSKNVANQEDCVWITGGGEIENEIRANAAGNICITLGNIGDITVAGSIQEPSGGFTETLDITTDVIFRNNVEVDGDVTQWNDARVVFEKNATVTGSVILEDGTLPTTMFPAAFGLARTRTGTAEDGPEGETVATSVRMGVRLASAAEDVEFSCTYRATMDEVRILDTPVVSLSVDNATVSDDAAVTVTITATLNKEHPVSGTTVTVPLAVSGTATAGTDYGTLADPFQIEISSGTTGTATIDITADTGAESAETIIVALGMLDEDVVRAGATSSVTITISATDAGNVFVDGGTPDMRFFKTQNTATAGPGFYIPGVQFKGMATIKEDLYVQSSEITNRPSAENRNDTRCAPRVIFAAAPAGKASSAMMSYVQRDVVIEEEHMDRILLDAEMGANMVISAHNLSVDGDIFATGDPFEMESAAVALDNGMCSNIFSLNAGTRLILSDDDGHVVDGAALMLDALVTNEDLEVNGALTVATLHVADGVEVESDATNSVTVNAGLILQGELDGELGDGSLTKLVYGTRRTDLVNVSDLTSLTVHIDDGEFRLDQVTNVKNFGLCKGEVVLFEAGGPMMTAYAARSRQFLTVKDGTLSLDTNEPGSIGDR